MDTSTPTGSTATLELWEALTATTPPARGATVLVARGLAPDAVAAYELPLAAGAREALAELRARTGPELDTVLACPVCEALLDVPLPLDGVLAGSDVDETTQRVGGVELRAPTTADVLAALDTPDPAATLRARCETWPAGTDPEDDPDLAARVAAAAERLAGAAGVSVRLDCPRCESDVLADVDVVRLLTERVTEQAHAVLTDVATLAVAFGWSEQEVLALSPARFRAYLDLVQARV
jgi:hypothetical protein